MCVIWRKLPGTLHDFLLQQMIVHQSRSSYWEAPPSSTGGTQAIPPRWLRAPSDSDLHLLLYLCHLLLEHLRGHLVAVLL